MGNLLPGLYHANIPIDINIIFWEIVLNMEY